MVAPTPAKSGFEKWQDGIDKPVGNAKWKAWDCEIQRTVNEYNRHLAGTAGYRPLDWHIVKAMLWVESGAESSEWEVKPMRIGVPGDPGLASLLTGREGGDLILPPAWKGRLTAGSARTNPADNIRAGTGYLLMKTAQYEYRSVIHSDDARIHEVTVKPGDSLDRIAKANGSTLEVLRKLNPDASLLRPGQVLRYQKASVQRVITSWRTISTAFVAQRDNGGRDPAYVDKLDYALRQMQKERDKACAH